MTPFRPQSTSWRKSALQPSTNPGADRSLSSSAFELASSPRIVRLALRTSVIVGSLLNLINQADALFGTAELNVFKLGLTYLVPYCVATYSAVSITLKRP
jgi:hypothetical protein